MDDAQIQQLQQELSVLLSSVYCTLTHDEIQGLCRQLLEAMPPVSKPVVSGKWDETTCMLITYGNSISGESKAPLQVLHQFLNRYLKNTISCVHLLPFYPFTSDDGFSVVDYRAVNPQLGEWAHIEALSEEYDIMFDAVVNHISSASEWFREYLLAYEDDNLFFTEVDPNEDLSKVTRPRKSPLLRAVDTVRGPKYVWCTFSHDQVDLNFSNPNVLLEIIKLFQLYLDKGAQWFRLDAVAFIWKKLGTTCISLPEVHQVIRAMRVLIEHANPKAVIVTETNVPLSENLAYFGEGDEAHMIYNFSLPPVLLQSLLSQDSLVLQNWLRSLPVLQEGTAFLNFIASHDGIGLRPAEGILCDEQLEDLKAHVQSHCGLTTDRLMPDGSIKAYELNISLFEALKSTYAGEDQYQIARFVLAYAIALALAGVPAIYIHSFLATGNDKDRYHRTGINRALNRHEWLEDELLQKLEDESSPQSQVLSRLRSLIHIRKQCKAFHPNAAQEVLKTSQSVLGLSRLSHETSDRVLAFYNLSVEPQEINLELAGQELISSQPLSVGLHRLQPYQCIWVKVA